MHRFWHRSGLQLRLSAVFSYSALSTIARLLQAPPMQRSSVSYLLNLQLDSTSCWLFIEPCNVQGVHYSTGLSYLPLGCAICSDSPPLRKCIPLSALNRLRCSIGLWGAGRFLLACSPRPCFLLRLASNRRKLINVWHRYDQQVSR